MTTEDEYDKFNVRVTNMSIRHIYNDVTDNVIDLNAPYQRDQVWDDKTRSFYINSIFINIIPNNIIINSTNGKDICVDGKQRLKSICKFKDNEIPVKVYNKKTGIDEYIYYSKIPENIDNINKNIRCFTQQEKTKFDNTNLNVVVYKDLSYEEQVDIFHRIQHGKQLTEGEKIGSLFKNENDCDTLNKFCEYNKNRLKKYCNIERKQHYEIIIMLLYLLDKHCIPEKNKRESYVNTFNNDKGILNKKLLTLQSVINTAFSDSILNNDLIPKNVIRNIVYAVIFFTYNVFITKKQTYEYNDSVIVKTILSIHKKYYRTDKEKPKAFIDYYNAFISEYPKNLVLNNTIKNNTKKKPINDKYDSDDSSESYE